MPGVTHAIGLLEREISPRAGTGKAEAGTGDQSGLVITGSGIIGQHGGTLHAVADDQIVGAGNVQAALAAGDVVAVDAIGGAEDADARESVAGAIVINNVAAGTRLNAVAGIEARDATAYLAAVWAGNRESGVDHGDAIRPVAVGRAIDNRTAQARDDARIAIFE